MPERAHLEKGRSLIVQDQPILFRRSAFVGTNQYVHKEYKEIVSANIP